MTKKIMNRKAKNRSVTVETKTAPVQVEGTFLLPEDGGTKHGKVDDAVAPVEAPEQGKHDLGPIPLSKIEVARANRSFQTEADDKFIEDLGKNIETLGLIEPLVLVVEGEGKERRIKVLAGANRYRAVLASRGPDGVLRPTEYVIRDGIGERGRKAAEISIAENRLRRGVSPYEKAVQAMRLYNDEKITQEQIADLLGDCRETILALLRLPGAFTVLPESWQRDLRQPPECDTNHITISHWRLVAGTMGDGTITPALREVMAEAHSKSWSVRRLEDELVKRGLRRTKPKDEGDDPPAGQPVDAGDDAGASASAASAGEQEPEYPAVIRGLNAALKAAHGNAYLAELVKELLGTVKDLAAKAEAEAKEKLEAAKNETK